MCLVLSASRVLRCTNSAAALSGGVTTVSGAPVAGDGVLRTRDLDVARARLSGLFCPLSIEVVGSKAMFEVHHRAAGLGAVALNHLDFGAEVRTEPDHISDFYLVHIPLAGAADTVSGHARVVSTPALATVASPGRPISKHWRERSPHLMVRFDRQAVETTLRQMLGRPLTKPLRFDLGLDLTLPPARAWLEVVEVARREVELPPSRRAHPLVEHHLQQLVITRLLLAARHVYSPRLHHDDPTPPPPLVRRAVDLIQRRAAEPLTVTEVAAAVGVGARALQQGFRTHLDTTPMSYFRQVRLERLHAELASTTPDARLTVTEIAHRWGFTHMSRMAQAYKAAYGESPSATLRHGAPPRAPRREVIARPRRDV